MENIDRTMSKTEPCFMPLDLLFSKVRGDFMEEVEHELDVEGLDRVKS